MKQATTATTGPNSPYRDVLSARSRSLRHITRQATTISSTPTPWAITTSLASSPIPGSIRELPRAASQSRSGSAQ